MNSRNWCFTLNNYVPEDIENISTWDTTYMVYGEEIGNENTPHLQGYVEWENSKRLTTLKKLNPRIHWEPRRGTREEAIQYCKKDGIITETGTLQKEQGKRNDLETIKTMVKAHAKAKAIWDVATNYQAIKMAEIGMKLYEPKRTWKPVIYWYWGPTGSGKTHRAFTEAIEPWVSGKSLKWWEGYDGHSHVIIDDFRADFCTFHELLRILDRYEYRVETKGGSRQLVAEKIWITSCLPPDKIYQKCAEDVAQLTRRIDHVIYLAQKLEDCAEVEGNTKNLDAYEEDNILDEDSLMDI